MPVLLRGMVGANDEDIDTVSHGRAGCPGRIRLWTRLGMCTAPDTLKHQSRLATMSKLGETLRNQEK